VSIEVAEALAKAHAILRRCLQQGANPAVVEDLLGILDTVSVSLDEIEIEDEIEIDSASETVQANDRTVAEVSRVLRKPEWIVRDRFDEAVQTLCARVTH